jgi:Aldose 1-epimerase
MSAGPHASCYKDQPAVTLESDTLAAQFLPGIDAKLCSLVYKPTGTELFVQRPAPEYRQAPYDGDYVAQGECSGFDDMFPAIDRGFYESYPWRGTPIPDHGEVWSLPWECSGQDAGLHFSVHGVRFPYRLEKSVRFTADGALRSNYRLTNLSSFDFDFMWAAHIMLNLEEGAVLTLPDGVSQICTALRFHGSLGDYGDTLTWPVATLADGSTRDLSHLRPKTTGDAVKYFVKGRMPQGWCALTYPANRFTLRLAFPAEQVPYFAVLPNEGGWQDLYSIFLEPATASFDRLEVARLRGECSTVKAHATYDWYLDLQLTRS